MSKIQNKANNKRYKKGFKFCHLCITFIANIGNIYLQSICIFKKGSKIFFFTLRTYRLIVSLKLSINLS